MQNFSLIPYLSAIRNVMVPLALQKISADKQVALATAVMEMVGLEDRLYHLPRELSAGQQQRVAIARAIINKPSIIFADEPTGNLDPVLAIEILDFLRDINRQKGITIIMVTHSPLANGYGTVRIHLNDGHIETYSEAAG
jgi:putative ABC transport system ATP-binding protein